MKIKIIILMSMIFLHIIDDFVLQQPWLAKGKQKSWWKINAPDELYKNDYKIALYMHSFSWAFCIMIAPILYTWNQNNTTLIVILFLLNMWIHYFIDDAKANKKLINLETDQSIHIVQILLTWVIICSSN